MLVLFETAAGFALFKVLDEGKLDKVEDIWKDFQTSESARRVVKLKAFSKFENLAEALSATTILLDSKPSKDLRKFLKKHCADDTLAVADSKLGNAIKEKLQIDCVHNNAVMELMRGLRNQLNELIMGLGVQDLAPMSLGLSHSLSRFKLKFSPDKVDTMIIQAIALLDDLDKELNTYAMRVREWYGWHFPELAKVLQDNIQYAKVVKLIGSRENAADTDFSEIHLPEEVESELKEAAVISMGTEISEHDMINIKALCDQVISLSEYRAQLYDYLRSRMNAIAPNLTAIVGELVGARLIAHAGSLINLAKQPSSTIQILGAEKALFRALKTKHETPKYGLIFHASLIGQAAPKLKGKISRSLAAKSALAIRFDALGESQDASIGLECRTKLEARLRQLEGRAVGRLSGSAKGKPKTERYDKDRKKDAHGLLTSAKAYNPTADSTLGNDKSTEKKRKVEEVSQEEPAAEVHKSEKKEKSEKKKKKHASDEKAQEEPETEVSEKRKKKKKNKEEDGQEEISPVETEKKKKKKSKENMEEEPAEEVTEKKKKKKDTIKDDVPVQDDGTEKKKKRKERTDEEEPKVEESEKKKKKKKKEK